jgi:hypothetical protein
MKSLQIYFLYLCNLSLCDNKRSDSIERKTVFSEVIEYLEVSVPLLTISESFLINWEYATPEKHHFSNSELCFLKCLFLTVGVVVRGEK